MEVLSSEDYGRLVAACQTMEADTDRKRLHSTTPETRRHWFHVGSIWHELAEKVSLLKVGAEAIERRESAMLHMERH